MRMAPENDERRVARFLVRMLARQPDVTRATLFSRRTYSTAEIESTWNGNLFYAQIDRLYPAGDEG